MNQNIMKRIALWGKLVGIVMMIAGALSGIFGLFAFVVGAVPGVIEVFVGFFIYKTGKAASLYLETSEEQNIEELLKHYGKYLLFQGVLLIVSIVLSIVSCMVFGAMIVAGLHGMGSY